MAVEDLAADDDDEEAAAAALPPLEEICLAVLPDAAEDLAAEPPLRFDCPPCALAFPGGRAASEPPIAVKFRPRPSPGEDPNCSSISRKSCLPMSKSSSSLNEK